MFDLYSHSLPAIFFGSLVVLVAAGELGFWIASRIPDEKSESTSMLAAAILGLLALMIGFTFSMALSRFEARQDAVLVEANTIGTAALRARLLPEPQRSQTLKLLQDYVKLRVDLTDRTVSREELDAAVANSNALQESLWQQAMAVAAVNTGMVPTGLYIQSLNDMIDSQEKRLTAVRNRMPEDVLLALFAIAAVAGGVAAYASAGEPRRKRWPFYVMMVLIAGVILLLLDLDRPDSGFIRVSQQPMIDTADSIAGFVK
jgi:FtsH-binding integral membrane protein